MTETHIAGELYGLSAHPGDIYHRAAMTVEALVRERDAEKADAAKWFAEYMALSHKQKGPVPDAALQARIAKLEAALHRITHEAKIRKALHAHDALDFAIIANDALKEPT